MFDQVRDELMNQFSGLTAYTRTPVSGLWQQKDGGTVYDQFLIYEVMAEKLDLSWWSQYRAELERRFKQDKLIIRAQKVNLL